MKALLPIALCILLAGNAHAFGRHGGFRMCLASIDDKGELQLREPHAGCGCFPMTHAITRQIDGKPVAVTICVKHSNVSETIIALPADVVQLFDTDGKEDDTKKLPELLKKERPVVVFDAGKKPDAAVLPLVKKGIPVLVLPIPFQAHGSVVAMPAIAVPAPAPEAVPRPAPAPVRPATPPPPRPGPASEPAVPRP